jgi:hypothetical protein
MAGPLEFHDGELEVLYEFDFSRRHEVRAGQTVTTAAVDPLEGGAATAKLTITGVVISTDGKKVQFRVSDTGASAGEIFELKCAVTLSGGATLIECGELLVSEC